MTLAKSLVDSDEIVRKYHRDVIERVFQFLVLEYSNTNEKMTEHQPRQDEAARRLAPFAERLGFQLRAAMTHRDIAVRCDSLSFIELLISHNNINSTLLTSIIQACVRGSSVTLSQSEKHFDIISSFVTDLYSKCLAPKAGNRHSSQLFRVGRIALQLFKSQSPTNISADQLPCDHSALTSKQISINSIIASLSGASLNFQGITKESQAFPSSTSSVSLSTSSTNSSPILQLISILIDFWSQLSTQLDQPPQSITNQKKISPIIEAVLRQIVSDFNLSERNTRNMKNQLNSNARMSFTPADEFILISAATRLDISTLILLCLRYYRDGLEPERSSLTPSVAMVSHDPRRFHSLHYCIQVIACLRLDLAC